MPNLQVVGKVEYNRFGFDFDDGSQSFLTDGGQQNTWLFGGDARMSFNLPASPIKPFAFAGAGMARISVSDFEGTDLVLTTAINDGLESVSEFYWNIGAGAEMKISPMVSFFAQARYINVATEGDALTWVPISLGLKFF
jgi:opacity protein-like surface antigen